MAVNIEALRTAVAEVWQRPRHKLDTATVLEVFPTQFSLMFLGAILGVLGLLISYIASQVGQTAAAKAVGPPGLIVGVGGWILFAWYLRFLLSGARMYPHERAFATVVIEHVLSQPAAPNFHLYERVALRDTLVPHEPTEADEDLEEHEIVVAGLHRWADQVRDQIAEALLAQTGVKADERLLNSGPSTAADVLRNRFQGRGTAPKVVNQYEVPLETGTATVWELADQVTFRFRWPGQTPGTFTPAGQKLADGAVHAQMTVVVTTTPAELWYLLWAEMGPLQPGPAPDTQALS